MKTSEEKINEMVLSFQCGNRQDFKKWIMAKSKKEMLYILSYIVSNFGGMDDGTDYYIIKFLAQ